MNLLRFLLAASLLIPSFAQDSAQTAKISNETSGPLALNFAGNDKILQDVTAKKAAKLGPNPNDRLVSMFTSQILGTTHFNARPLDDTISSRFFDRYLEMWDGTHMHFLQSDVKEFEVYRTKLDDLIAADGDASPAYKIFSRFLERVEQRVLYVAEELKTEKFDFTADDRYMYNRKSASYPATLDEAKQIWRQHLRYEILQEKLSKEKPEEIATKIMRRYARLLRTLKDYDSEDVFEIYMSSLTHVYDPHSAYMGKSASESFAISMRLSLFGIGALLQSEDGYCTIKSVVVGGPADRSKRVKENDKIIAVAQSTNEPVDVVDMKLSKVVEMIRGAKGSEVRLTIIPADAADPSVRRTVALVRDEIKLDDQEAKAKIVDMPGEGGKTVRVGVIDLPSFYRDFRPVNGVHEVKSTTTDVEKLLRRLKKENVEGVVLDLRRNGGGSLEEAINLTGLFIKEGPVVQVKWPVRSGRNQSRVEVDRDDDPEVAYDGPLVVLTSRFSASASEILAGALQDYGRALIAGDSSTHGKGTVQSLIALDEAIPNLPVSMTNLGQIKLTIRKFYRATGSSTQLKGVTPDIVFPSRNNFAEVGEGSLDAPLPWDTIASADFEKMNRIQPILPELQKRFEKRLATDKDLAYVKEDAEIYRKTVADKSISLNEAKRIQEKEDIENREKSRTEEIKSRKAPAEVEYDITLKTLNDPLKAVTPEDRKAAAKAHAAQVIAAEDDDEDAADDENKFNPAEVPLKEAKRILMDMISLMKKDRSVATSQQ